MNAELGPYIHKDMKDIAITIRSMDIELLNADPNPCGHQTGKKRYETMETLITGIIIQGIAIITIKNMDTFLRIE